VRHFSLQRGVAGSGLAALALCLAAAPVGLAASRDRVGAVVLDRYAGAVSLGDGAAAVHPRALPGDRITRGAAARASSTHVLAPGRVNVAGGARAASGYTCVNDRRRRGFVAYRPFYFTVNKKAIYIQFVYNIYKQNRARRLQGVGGSKQLEMCSTGGAHARGGNHLSRVGTHFAATNRSPTIIGSRWGTKTRSSNVSASLGFAVPVGPVTINGSVSVHPQDSFTGGQGPDKDTAGKFDPYVDNQVNGLWEGSSTFRWQGSTHFEGNVAHGLWEYPQRAPSPRFVYQATHERFCGHPFGIGCA
jgi:hypothetical protein